MAVYDDRIQLSRYRELYPLKDDGTVQLVRDDRTGETQLSVGLQN